MDPGQSPLSTVGVFTFLWMDKEKLKKQMLPWPSASRELVYLLLPEICLTKAVIQVMHAGDGGGRMLSSDCSVGSPEEKTHAISTALT